MTNRCGSGRRTTLPQKGRKRLLLLLELKFTFYHSNRIQDKRIESFSPLRVKFYAKWRKLEFQMAGGVINSKHEIRNKSE
jgi:hypothetical protein